MRGRPGVALSALMIVAGLSACAPPAEPIESLTVTESEYRAAFDAFAACMDREGFELVRIDDSDPVIDYSFPADAVESGSEALCYADFETTEIAWQLQNSYDDLSSQQVRDCLAEAGITPSGTVEGEFAQLVEAGLQEDCLSVPPSGMEP